MPAICALAVGDWSFDRCNDGVIHMGVFTPQTHYHMHETSARWGGFDWLWHENAQTPQFTGRSGDVLCTYVATSRLFDQTGCHIRPTSLHEHRVFFSLSLSLALCLRHMCEFYHSGWAFQRSLDLSNKPQQAVKPSFSASHRDRDSQWRSESGDWNLITALKPSESNMRERDET